MWNWNFTTILTSRYIRINNISPNSSSVPFFRVESTERVNIIVKVVTIFFSLNTLFYVRIDDELDN